MEPISAELPQAIPTGYEIPHVAGAAATALPDVPMGPLLSHAAVGSVLPGAALTAATPVTPLQALQAGNLGVGFSGTGFLLMYFVGVTSILRSLGIITSNTRVAGASGGSVTAGMMCSNMTNPQFASIAKSLAVTCNVPFPSLNCEYTLDTVARTGLNLFLPVDTAARCQGRLFAAITSATTKDILGRSVADPGVLVQNFTSKTQVVNTLLASSYIPRFSGVTAVTAPVSVITPTGASVPAAYDGVFTVPLPVPPVPSNGYVITVSALANGTNPPDFDAQLLPRANAPSLNPADFPYLPLTPVKQTPPARIDIYPGLGGALRFTNKTWNDFTLIAPNNAQLQILYDTGRADAAAWCGQKFMANATAINTALNRTALNITTLQAFNLSATPSG